MDPLFYMQRYWGSDDSDDDEDNHNASTDKLQNLLKTVETTKKNGPGTELDSHAGDPILEENCDQKQECLQNQTSKTGEKKLTLKNNSFDTIENFNISPLKDDTKLVDVSDSSDRNSDSNCYIVTDSSSDEVEIISKIQDKLDGILSAGKKGRKTLKGERRVVEELSAEQLLHPKTETTSEVKKKKKRNYKKMDNELDICESQNSETDMSEPNRSGTQFQSSPDRESQRKGKDKRKRLSDSNIIANDFSVDDDDNKNSHLTDESEEASDDNFPSSKKHKKLLSEITDNDEEMSDVGEPEHEASADADIKDEAENNSEDSKFFPIIKDVQIKKQDVERILPDWLSKPTFIQVDLFGQEKPVSDLDFLDDSIKENLLNNNIKHLFPVQFHVIPWLLQSSSKRCIMRPSDLCVSAPTGSGKTLAYVIPIIQALKNKVIRQIRAVVVLPVGELAIQVFKVFQKFCKDTDVCVSLVIGQKSFPQEQSQLVKRCSRGFMSLTDIIVCTPRRLLDHVSLTEGFSLQNLHYIVIDEADRMMEEIQLGWLKKVEEAVYKNTNYSGCKCFTIESIYMRQSSRPSNPCMFGCVSEPVQKLLFSATLSQEPDKLHELSLYRPKLFTSVSEMVSSENAEKEMYSKNLIGKYVTPPGLTEQYVVCDPQIKPLIVCSLLKRNEYKKVLCFTSSLEHAHRLYLVLSKMLNETVRELSSNNSPIQRKIILDQLSSGKIRLLVCSDIMARGMDIEDVDCVISYDAPTIITKYVHRMGRTARAGKEGVGITLLELSEVSRFKRMLTSSGKLLASKLEVNESDLLSMETDFQDALTFASVVIVKEKSGMSFPLIRDRKLNKPDQSKRTSFNAGNKFKPTAKFSISNRGRPYNRISNRGRPYNNISNRGSSRPHISRPYNRRPYISRPYNRPHISRPYNRRPYISRPYNRRPHIRRPYNRKPNLLKLVQGV